MTDGTLRRSLGAVLSALLIASLVSACATRPPKSDLEARAEFERINDPLEPLNRKIFAFNMTADRLITRPIAKGYRAVVPKPVRQGVRNALENIETPWTIVNSILQGKFGRAGTALSRFLINSTIGIGGLFDVATDAGIEAPEEEDLGQTFAVWGIGEGPFLMLPFLGPSNPRDSIGFAGQIFGDPAGIAIDKADVKGLQAIVLGLEVIDAREAALDTVDQLLRESQDPYVALRSAYRQNRRFEITDGEISEEEDDLFDDPFEEDFEDEVDSAPLDDRERPDAQPGREAEAQDPPRIELNSSLRFR